MTIASISSVPWGSIGLLSSVDKNTITKIGPIGTQDWIYHPSVAPSIYACWLREDRLLLSTDDNGAHMIRLIDPSTNAELMAYPPSAWNPLYAEGDYIYQGSYDGYIEVIDTTAPGWISTTYSAGYHPNRGMSSPSWPNVYFMDSGGSNGVITLNKSSHSVGYVAGTALGAFTGACTLGDNLYAAVYYYNSNPILMRIDGPTAALMTTRTFTEYNVYDGEQWNLMLTDGTRLWVAGYNMLTILELDPTDLSTIATYNLPVQPKGQVAYSSGKIWFMPSDGNVMYAVDVNTQEVTTETVGDSAMRLGNFSQERIFPLVMTYGTSTTPNGYMMRS